MRARILIIDDDPDIALPLEQRLTAMGHEILIANNGKEGLHLIEQEQPDLVLLDLELPFVSGLEVLRQVRQESIKCQPVDDGHPPVRVAYTTPLIVILTAFGTVERAVQAMQLGAFDFVPKPFTKDHLAVVLNKALTTVSLHRHIDILRKEVDDQFEPIVSTSKQMNNQLSVAKQAASSSVTVLLLGATGTGKEVVARTIHRWSPRSTKPFIAVNCAAFPENLLENELFGHEKGAFTGANKREPGKIEIAEGGTLFLDEIGDMPLTMQSHLLRVLQDRTFYRVGGTREVRTDVRFLAATNKDLHQAIRQGTFREDLYFRLAVITINLPPLRERMDDLPALAKHFLSQPGRLGLNKRCALSNSALDALQSYPWPGNVRELENVLTRALVLCLNDTIEPEHLSLPTSTPSIPSVNQEPNTNILFSSYHKSMDTHSQKLIETALRRNEWNRTKTAAELGLQRTYLTKLLRKWQISDRPPGFPTQEAGSTPRNILTP